MTQTVCDFGFGAVPAHRHSNGGGWVANTAYVDPTAFVGPDAQVFGNALVCGDAQVHGDARVRGDAQVYGDARVYGNARVYDNALVCGRCSRSPLYISGYEYSVTVCDDVISVGCQKASLEKWSSGWAPEKAPLLERSRELLLALAEMHQNGVG